MAEDTQKFGRYMTLDEILPTIAPERRAEVVAQLVAHVRERERVSQWVNKHVEDMLDVPGIIYKYIPCCRLDDGCPLTLRATQPVALNDVMEGNVSTYKADADMDRDRWYEMLGERLREIFGEHSLSPEELERRKRRYGDPRVSTIVRDYLSRFVGVLSFSADPLIPTMWAHYAENSGFVVGYRTDAIRPFSVGLRRVLYMELAPIYWPENDDTVEINFIDEERRKAHPKPKGIPILGSYDFLTLGRDWKTLCDLLFVKSDGWKSEREIRLLVDRETTRRTGKDDPNGHEVRVVDVPADAIEEVYVGFNTPDWAVRKISEIVGNHGSNRPWKLKYTDSHAYRMEVTSTSINNRRAPKNQT